MCLQAHSEQYQSVLFRRILPLSSVDFPPNSPAISPFSPQTSSLIYARKNPPEEMCQKTADFEVFKDIDVPTDI